MSHLLLCLCFIPWVCVYFHLPCFSMCDSLRVSASLCDLCQVCHASPVLLLHFLFYFGGWCSLSWVSLLFPRLIINPIIIPTCVPTCYPYPHCPVLSQSPLVRCWVGPHGCVSLLSSMFWILCSAYYLFFSVLLITCIQALFRVHSWFLIPVHILPSTLTNTDV